MKRCRGRGSVRGVGFTFCIAFFLAAPVFADNPHTLRGETAVAPSSAAALPDKMAFALGAALFGKLWVSAPASTKASDGLGPLFNSRACTACHGLNGHSPAPGGGRAGPPGLVLRLGLADLSALADPGYGRQLQTASTPGIPAEGQVRVSYTFRPVTLADGTIVTLRVPDYFVEAPGYGPLDPRTALSPRAAPRLVGPGLLEAIPEADILQAEDPDDRDGNGISGRANRNGGALGRFGLKAAEPTLLAQTAQAFATDMGLSNPLHPNPWGDCTPAQTACRTAPDGQEPGIRDGLEVDAETLALVAAFVANLSTPARQNADDPTVLRGKQVFHNIGCTGCHIPSYTIDRPPHGTKVIRPYTDLLLHDMGPGLADGLPEGLATGSEWRTAPLWGLAQAVSSSAGFLHDGRARTILEAILWHGGEAQAQRDAVVALHPEDRHALLTFLESL